MARVKRSAELQSIDARRRLKIRREPYFVVIEPGLAIGYRRAQAAGTWVARRYDRDTRRNTERRIGTADDYRAADGTDVLTFAQAQRRILAELTLSAEYAAGRHYTVAAAVADYIEYLRLERKTADDTAIKLNAYAVPFLGSKRLSDLTPVDFDEWVAWALKRQQRRKAKKSRTEATRRKKGMQAAPKEVPGIEVPAVVAIDADELRRRRKSTLNRVITSLKAALNHAHGRGKVTDRNAWAKLHKFKGADSARLRWLTEDEAKRLTNAAARDLRQLIQGGLMTGCRPGELARAKTRDFDSESETLLVAESKSSKPRRVPLTTQGVQLLESITAAKESGELIFTRADGSPWNRVAVLRGMQVTSDAAKLSPRATFYSLRHTYASHLVQQGTPLLFVASVLGHQNVRMVEKHYGHFTKSHVADAIKAKLPTFGIKAEPQKVRKLRK